MQMQVMAAFGQPGEEGAGAADGSSTLSGAYSSGGDSMHFSTSGKLVTDSETGKAA
jgi:hypothetical protein